MFHFFFQEYKRIRRKQYLANFKRFPILLRVLAVIGIVGVIAMAVVVTIVPRLMNMAIMGGTMLYTILIVIGCCIYDMKNRDSEIKRYKEGTLNPLKNLLQDKRFGFYTVANIDWLIASCDAEIAAGETPRIPLVKNFATFVFPVITLFIGVLINAVSLEISIRLVGLAILIWALLSSLRLLLSDFIDYIRFPNKGALLSLKTDLQYLRLEKEKETKNHSTSVKLQEDATPRPAGG